MRTSGGTRLALLLLFLLGPLAGTREAFVSPVSALCVLHSDGCPAPDLSFRGAHAVALAEPAVRIVIDTARGLHGGSSHPDGADGDAADALSHRDTTPPPDATRAQLAGILAQRAAATGLHPGAPRPPPVLQ